MEQYLKLGRFIVVGFMKLVMAQVLRSDDRMADALSNLASSTLYSCHIELNIMARPSINDAVVLTIETQTNCSRMSPISSYLISRTLLEDRREVAKVKARAARYTLLNGVLYRRSFSEPYQRCVLPDEAKRITEKI